MTTSNQVLQLRQSDGNLFVVPVDVINRHRAEYCARHDASAGLCPYEMAFAAELAYGRGHPSALENWARDQSHWAELEPHARLLRESWRG